MDFDLRKCVVEYLRATELKYDVETWRVEKVDIWPILKVAIFFEIFDKGASPAKKVKRSKWEARLKHFLKVAKAHKLKFKFYLNPATACFCGAASHRVTHNGESFNRYFDPLVDHLSETGYRSVILEYGQMTPGPLHNADKVVYLTDLSPAFRPEFDFVQSWGTLMANRDFRNFVNEISQKFEIDLKRIEGRFRFELTTALSWRALFGFVFRKLKPQLSFGLCYYSAEMVGMILAAKELGILSFDMQHGSQGELHPAYNFSAKCQNLNTLPDCFWTWDSDSSRNLATWLGNKPHRIVLGGNPWISFHRSSPIEWRLALLGKPIIIFTHQPIPSMPPIDNAIVEVIDNTKNDYLWALRFHPRTTKEEKEVLFDILMKRGLLNYVDIEDASVLPLPLVLKSTSVHISQYSGSIIEADLLNVPSIIVGKIGNATYRTLIESGRAMGVEYPEQIAIQKAIALLLKKSSFENTILDYKDKIDELLQKN